MNENLIKRKYVYLQQPIDYEIDGCACGNINPEWSEYEGHLWCAKCAIDFKPKYNGIFDGPIPLGLSKMFGINFHRLNLVTKEVELYTSKGNYTKAIDLRTNINKADVQVVLNDSIKGDRFVCDVTMSLQDFSLRVKNNKKINSRCVYVTFYTKSLDNSNQEWNLEAINQDDKIEFVQNERLNSFKKFIFNQKLERELGVSPIVKSEKI